MDQMALFNTAPVRCCQTCHWWAPLVKPYVRDDGSIIYGYCFAGGSKDHNPNMGKGLAVFFPPDADVPCGSFKKEVRK